MCTGIWKKPIRSESAAAVLVSPDSASDAITGSSGGNPAAAAAAPIQRASAACDAPSPGYGYDLPGTSGPVAAAFLAAFDPPHALVARARATGSRASAGRNRTGKF